MPSEATNQARDLSDFVDLFAELDREGVAYVVIGGCAVGAYARLAGETVLSDDLDLYLTHDGLAELLAWARRTSIPIEKTPQARSVPVAVLRWRGLEINALTASDGLPPADTALRDCREFELKASGSRVYVADPYELLSNKRRIGRPKDVPHIRVLERYLELEVQAAFEASGSPRDRMMPAKRLMSVLGLASLPPDLVQRLVPFANAPPLRRFLAVGLTDAGLREQLMDAATTEEEQSELLRIFCPAP